MGIQLSTEDFGRLVSILGGHGEWQSVRGRIDFMADVFAGSQRKEVILGQLNLDGTPRGTAVQVITRLAQFGQDQAGRESMGVLINKMIAYLGGGDDADFLRDLLVRYPFQTRAVAARGIGTWRGRETAESVAEKIIGNNPLRDVYVLEGLIELSHAVARIVSPGGGAGTGFLIASDLLITNNHVIPTAEAAKGCEYQFNYQLDRRGKELPVVTATALDGGVFRTSPMAPDNAVAGQLDYTIVQIAGVPRAVAPLRLRACAVKRESRLAVIGHPSGRYKKISLQNNSVEYLDEYVLQYTSSTETGSSGSPVISDDLEVVALHHTGGMLREPATSLTYLRNEGIRVAAILGELQQNAPEIHRRVTE